MIDILPRSVYYIWLGLNQLSVSLSTYVIPLGTEYMDTSTATHEALWTKNLLEELGINI